MILVKSKLGKSSIHGIGLFAEQHIAKGDKVWEFNEVLDCILSQKDIENLQVAAKEQVMQYAYRSKHSGHWVLCNDDSRFFNHANSIDANVQCYYDTNEKSSEPLVCIAIQDIEPGEELTHNYSDFDLENDLV
jgi:SET domain-containing protein